MTGLTHGTCVFIHRSDSRYDDIPAERYQFPGNYLTRVQACINDWIVYLEPSKVRNTRGYFAIAKIEKVVPDPTAPNMYLALIEPGSYMDFINPVPFNDGTGIVEQGLLNENRRISGRAQSAVRSISPEDFDRILELGFDEKQLELPRVGDIEGYQPVPGMAEVNAAHIKPVKDNGPDILSNGIALSGTVHWMFDRGMIGLSDSYEIMISRQVNDPESIESLINKTGKAIVPELPVNQPHPAFLQWHRENCFKV